MAGKMGMRPMMSGISRSGTVKVNRTVRASHRLGGGHLPVIETVVRPPLLLQQTEGEKHIVHRHRLAIGKAGGRVQDKADEAAGAIRLDAFPPAAHRGERLVIAAHHKALKHVAAQESGGRTSCNKRVKAVERACQGERQPPPFGAAGLA